MNSSRIWLMVISMVVVQTASGQDFITRGATPDLHLLHTVAAKETWYSISKTYNLTPAEIALYNKQTVAAPLEIGQALKIPLTPVNFSQNENKGPGEVPVYHIVQDKEWMYRISMNHNKVPIERLEKWNSISRDQAKSGMKLLVGYLKTNGTGTATASKPISTETPGAPAGGAVASKEQPRRVQVKAQPSSQAGVSDMTGGYFKSQFEGSGRTHSGVSGIFKSTSGWNDGKFYALMNNITVGTIVKVNLPQTNKTIYAKVLGELPDMKESAGLALRISDAAARELGASTSKFSVDVAY